jgi:hypothetical protein
LAENALSPHDLAFTLEQEQHACVEGGGGRGDAEERVAVEGECEERVLERGGGCGGWVVGGGGGGGVEVGVGLQGLAVEETMQGSVRVGGLRR